MADVTAQPIGPVPLDGCRAWLAIFDSYDPRTNDLYFIVTILDRGVPQARYVTAMFPYWAPEEWDDPSHAPKLHAALHRAAIEGQTNTTYQGTQVAWHLSGGRLPAAQEK